MGLSNFKPRENKPIVIDGRMLRYHARSEEAYVDQIISMVEECEKRGVKVVIVEEPRY